MDRVDQTLKHWRQTEFVWGETDCVMSLFDYARPVIGRDAGEPWRGTYHSEDEANAILEQWGGHASILATSGLEETDEPGRGDIVILDSSHGDNVTGLCTGDGIVMRLPRGTIEVARKFMKISKAWKVS